VVGVLRGPGRACSDAPPKPRRFIATPSSIVLDPCLTYAGDGSAAASLEAISFQPRHRGRRGLRILPLASERAGNDPELVEFAVRNATAIGAGHSFVVFLREGYPVNVLNQLKQVPEVCRIFCATANPVEVVVAETKSGRGVLGVIDGRVPLGEETDEDVAARHELLRGIGYKP
jgi:hypothetical protein